MHVAIDAAIFMLTHLVRHNACRIIDLRKSGRTRRSADIFPSRAAVAAARDAALFDTDDDFIRHARIERDAARMRHVWRPVETSTCRNRANCGTPKARGTTGRRSR